MAKKVWTPAARKAFAAKMKAARLAKRGRRKNPAKAKLRIAHITDYSRGGQGFTALVRGKRVIARYTNMADAKAAYQAARRRRKNPTKAEVKAAAAKIAKAAGRLAWRGAKLTGRVGKASAKAAAAEVKASICRTRAKNPKRRRRRFSVAFKSAGQWHHVVSFADLKTAKRMAHVVAKAYLRPVRVTA